MPLRRVVSAVILFLLLAAAAVFFLWDKIPYQNLAARQITHLLEARGLAVESLSVERLDKSSAVLADIRLGGAKPMEIGRLSVTFSLDAVARGKFDTVEIEDAALHLYREKDAWRIGGLEAFFAAPASSEPVPVKEMLPEKLIIKNASCEMALGDYRVAAGGIGVEFLKNTPGEWRGLWRVRSITAAGFPEAPPPLAAQGALMLAGMFTADAEAGDAAKQWSASISFAAPPEAPAKGELTLKRIRLPWGGGTVGVADARLPLSRTSPALIPVAFQDVDLMALLGPVSGGKVQGSGKVSGVLPIAWHPDGHVTLENGTAQASGGGVIAVSPDMFAGQDSAPMQTVRDALKNFQYSSLAASFSSDADEKTAIRLTVEGKNPDTFEGRPVKLNVNLTGDIVPLIRQSILPAGDPAKFLEKK